MVFLFLARIQSTLFLMSHTHKNAILKILVHLDFSFKFYKSNLNAYIIFPLI